MSISLLVPSSFDKKCEALLFVLSEQDFSTLPSSYVDVCSEYGVDLAGMCKAFNFSGKAGSSCSFVAGSVPVVCVGTGALNKTAAENMDVVRKALGSGYKALCVTKKESVGVVLPGGESFEMPCSEFKEHAGIVLMMASYTANALKKEKQMWQPSVVLLTACDDDIQALENATIIGEAVNMTRTLADLPGNHLYPEILARKVKEMASDYRLLYKEISQDEARDMGMGCFYSVAKGSDNPGRVVILEHKPKNGTATKTIGLVGKGVCYDTGGISLKPSSYMHGMKYDMSGAAAVFAAMRVIAALDLNINVVAVTPLVENMPSARASKQDDVVTALNGSTVEIDNTDAEGRLILCDALTYIQKEYNPDLLIDIATLTGSCAAALGYYHSGLMTRDEEMSESLLEVGKFVGDKLWRLPLTDEYKSALESPVADIVNCAPAHYKAGATMAGIFLEHFVDKDRRWAHLDIAGTDSKVPNVSYIGKTATGVGARILIEFIRRNAA